MTADFVRRTRGRLVYAYLSLAALTWAGACLDGTGPQPPIVNGLMLSDTTSPIASATSSAAPSPSTRSELDVAYVSLPPGATPDGALATIRNLSSGSTVTVLVDAGGFDPVAISAAVGDTIETVVRNAAGAVALQAQLVVAASRRPVVVRTDPPPRKRDVPLNATIVVVFSEPIDPASLTSSALILRRGQTAVSGRIQIADAEGLSVAFVPDAWLADTTKYELIVSESIRDRDGEALGARMTVEFVTQEFSADIGPIAFQIWHGRQPGDVEYGGSSIYVLENSKEMRLSGPNTRDVCPSWSPDGLKIAFLRSPPNGPVERVHVMQRDGSDIKVLAPIDGGCPAWSPDGSRLAFAGSPSLGRENSGLQLVMDGIYVMNADGSNLFKVTDQPASGHAPSWSPDGRRIAFTGLYCVNYCGVSIPDSDTTFVITDTDITIVNADGSSLTRLALGSDDHGPAWSPDGTTIAFSRVLAELSGIYAMKPDGSNLRKLMSEGGGTALSGHSWSPDGKMIAFLSGRDGNHLDLYVMNADGSGIRRLTNSAENRAWPSWSPARIP